MTTATPARTDEQIQREVLDELKWDARVHPNEIGVIVKDGIVTLTGWVDSYLKKWEAEQAAHRVRGVRAVANDIEVRLPLTAERTDADLAAAALHALQASALLPAERLEVTVSWGWVTLKGEVEWYFQKEDAERVVCRLAGVKGVTNLIRVRPQVKPSPAELKRRIEEALMRNAETDAEKITVRVDGETVILLGSVCSWAEVERLTGLGSDDFKEAVHLARLGRYLGDAGLTEAGDDLLAVLAKAQPGATPG